MVLRNWKKISNGYWKYTGHRAYRNVRVHLIQDPIDKTWHYEILEKGTSKHIFSPGVPYYKEAKREAVKFMKKHENPKKLESFFEEEATAEALR